MTVRARGRFAVLAACAVLSRLATAGANEMTVSLEPDPRVQWTAVNDAVMGGVSEGSVSRTADGRLVFEGRLSFANNGGFASARRSVALPAGAHGLTFGFLGDGRRYKVALYTALGGSSGHSYQAELVAGPGRGEVFLAWSDFRARFRGRPVPGAPPLRPEDVRSLGLLIADESDVPFRLVVESLAVGGRGAR